MIEELMLEYLKGRLNVEVLMEESDETDQEYILIEKIGGGIENHIKRATMTIQSYATSLYRAAELNEVVKDVMEGMIELNEVCKCSLNSDYNFTDTQRKKYRYQAVYDITHY